MKRFMGLVLTVWGCSVGCAAGSPQQTAHLDEINQKIRALEAEREQHAQRIAALEAQLESPRDEQVKREPIGSRPLLRVVRLEPPTAAPVALQEPAATTEGNKPDEHVLLSGSGSNLRAETVSEAAAEEPKP
jgi:hypothetical protein